MFALKTNMENKSPYKVEYSFKTSIHILMDELLLKIFKFLPLRKLISLERTCRRWQILIYKIFSIKKDFVLKRNIINYPHMIEPAIKKLMFLMSQKLKYIKVKNFYFNIYFYNNNVLKIISQFCSELECLELSYTNDIKVKNLTYLSKKCKKIKTIIVHCCNTLFFAKMLKCFPNLEYIYVTGMRIKSKNFRLLPNSLKVLYFNCNYNSVPTDNLKFIGDNCINLRELYLKKNICF